MYFALQVLCNDSNVKNFISNWGGSLFQKIFNPIICFLSLALYRYELKYGHTVFSYWLVGGTNSYEISDRINYINAIIKSLVQDNCSKMSWRLINGAPAVVTSKKLM